MTSSLHSSIGFFSGLNTVDDPVRLRTKAVVTNEGHKAAYPLTEAVNVEIDNDYALSSRDGLTEKMTGTAMYSFWADEKGDTCLFMDGTNLYEMRKDYTTELIDTLSSNNRVSFTEFNSKTYYTNRVDIGYVEGSVGHGLSAPTIRYKQVLPAGDHICYHKGRLYVAVKEVLFVSDVLSDCYDTRYGYRVFNADIDMLLSVDDGLYVAANRTWFLSQGETVEGDQLGLHRNMVDKDGVVPYTGIRVSGDEVSEGVGGMVGMWVSRSGVCVGDSQGKVTNLTNRNYVLANSIEGSSVLRNNDGITHFLSVLRR